MLTKDYFQKTTTQILEQINLYEAKPEINYEWLETKRIQNIEMCIAFLTFMDLFDESILRKLYKQTYKQRKELVSQIKFPTRSGLKKLEINYKKLA